MNKKFPLLLVSLLIVSVAHAEDLKNELYRKTSSMHVSFSYSHAKTKLFNEIYLQKDAKGYFLKGVYCLDKYYPFDGANPNNRLPDPNVFNTEHTWPQSKFSTFFNKKTQKSDLHHLFPTFSQINSERGNLPFAEVDSAQDLFCNESQSGNATSGERGPYFEPPDDHKGNVARAMFYFSIRYKIAIDSVQENFLRLWHEEDVVDEAEAMRHEKIFKLQRNRNPFIDSPELVSQIKDF